MYTVLNRFPNLLRDLNNIIRKWECNNKSKITELISKIHAQCYQTAYKVWKTELFTERVHCPLQQFHNSNCYHKTLNDQTLKLDNFLYCTGKPTCTHKPANIVEALTLCLGAALHYTFKLWNCWGKCSQCSLISILFK